MKTTAYLSLTASGSGMFHIQPVTLRNFPNPQNLLSFEDVLSTGSILCLDEDEVAYFLASFFRDAYDSSLSYNVAACAVSHDFPSYEPNLRDNFYT